MQYDYSLASPSLEGLLTQSSLSYEGIDRPLEALRAFDRHREPGERGYGLKALERYLYDLYGVFMKKLSSFILEPSSPDEDAVKLQAILQEMIKVKKLMRP